MTQDRNPRREFLAGSAALLSGLALAPVSIAQAKTEVRRKIPSSGEHIFPIGMGTWITFNVGRDPQLRDQRADVLETFFDYGGQLVDSSPMYGSAEQVVGHALGQINNGDALFSATKTWTQDPDDGRQQFAASQHLWGLRRFDLVQVHNLLNWQEQLPMLHELKQQGLVRYIGITTSHGRRHDDMAALIRSGKVDVAQFSYNALNRDAEHSLLPLARDMGVATIINRPFQTGRLFSRFERYPLPPWHTEIGCQNWAQFFLRFVLSHPAVTCVIPATSKVRHMHENMQSLAMSSLPTQAQRQRMVRYLESL